MITLALTSAVGGAGTSTLTAALATLLARMQRQVLVLECDAQNTLSMHFGMGERSLQGLAANTVDPRVNADASINAANWAEGAFQTQDGIAFLPYGSTDEKTRYAFEKLLYEDPQWLKKRLAQIDLPSKSFVLLDVQRMPSVYFQQACHAADCLLTILPARPLAYATLPQLEQAVQQFPKLKSLYIANQQHAAHTLERDLHLMMAEQLQERLAPVAIHFDSVFAEAFAKRQFIADYAPHSQTAQDLQNLLHWLLQQL